MMNRVITVFGWLSFAVLLCPLSFKVVWQFLMAGIWNLWYPMKSFTFWILYSWKHVRYYTKYHVMIITQFPYIVRLVNFGFLRSSFYIRLGYFCNLFSDNAIFMVISCLWYLLVYAITFSFDQRTGNFCNPLQSTEFVRTMTWL